MAKAFLDLTSAMVGGAVSVSLFLAVLLSTLTPRRRLTWSKVALLHVLFTIAFATVLFGDYRYVEHPETELLVLLHKLGAVLYYALFGILYWAELGLQDAGLRVFVRTVAWLTVPLVLYALLADRAYSGGFVRIESRNELGFFLGLSSSIFFGYYLGTRRIFWLVASGVSALSFVALLTKTPMVALLVAASVGAWSAGAVGTWLLLVGFASIPLVLIEPITQTLMHYMSDLDRLLTLTGRVRFWELAITRLGDDGRWLLGYGYGSGRYSLYGAAHAHNEFVQVMYEGGLPLAVAVVAILSWALSKLVVNIRRTRHNMKRMVGNGSQDGKAACRWPEWESDMVILCAGAYLLVTMMAEVRMHGIFTSTLACMVMINSLLVAAFERKRPGNYVAAVSARGEPSAQEKLVGTTNP